MIKDLKQQRLDGLMDALYGTGRNNKKEITNIIEFKDVLKLNKKKYRDLKINYILEKFKNVLEDLEIIIDEYKVLKNRTEFWERKSTYDFDFENWNTIKKVNGHITRYYNELQKVKNSIEKEYKKGEK